MATISVTLPSDGESIDAADVNTPINTIVNAINGNLDSDNIKDASITPQKLTNFSSLSWTSVGYTPNTVTANGNRSYSLVVNSNDLTTFLSPGMRLKTTRTVAAPTQCTSLNGTTQYYSKSSPAGMTFTNNFVVSAWVKLSSYPSGYGTIASRYNGTSGWWFLVTSNGQVLLSGINAGAGNFSQVVSYQSIPLNKWVHITAQLDMTSTTNSPTVNYVMIDGVDVPATVLRGGTTPTSLVQAGNLEIGSANGGLASNLFPGKIAQVAIYSAKVTQATITASISQTLTGSETSLISAYSFNNAITDLNTTNANNLTANGSAVATNTDSPFGGQASGSISSTLDYGIITSISYSTNTTMTVMVPETNTIPTTGGISALSYSIQANPYGFPNVDYISRYTRSVQNTSSASLTNTEADLRSYGLLQTITSYGSAVAQVRVDMGINSSSDYEFWPEVWVNGSKSKSLSPAAALATANNRANVRGFTCEIPLTDGTNIISAGYFLSNSVSAGLATNGGSLTVSIVKGYGTGN